jgi:hypothetical protein
VVTATDPHGRILGFLDRRGDVKVEIKLLCASSLKYNAVKTYGRVNE